MLKYRIFEKKQQKKKTKQKKQRNRFKPICIKQTNLFVSA